MKKKNKIRNITVRKPWYVENKFGMWKTAPLGVCERAWKKRPGFFARLLRWFLEQLN
jgi:hypothetical protein